MAPILLWLILVLCLSLSVVKYLMGTILKFSFPSRKVQRDYTYQPTVSVLMPATTKARRCTRRSRASVKATIRATSLK